MLDFFNSINCYVFSSLMFCIIIKYISKIQVQFFLVLIVSNLLHFCMLIPLKVTIQLFYNSYFKVTGKSLNGFNVSLSREEQARYCYFLNTLTSFKFKVAENTELTSLDENKTCRFPAFVVYVLPDTFILLFHRLIDIIIFYVA